MYIQYIISTRARVCGFLRKCACDFVCLRVCCVYLWVYVYVCMGADVRVRAYVRLYSCVRISLYLYIYL